MFTDQQILEQMQYALLEPPDLGQTWPSELWDTAEMVAYVDFRQNMLLKDTHLEIGIANIPAVTGQFQYDLPFDWINTIRIVWIDAGTKATKELIKSDTWIADHGVPIWTTQTGTPKIYLDVDTSVLTFKVAPAPNTNGTIQIHYVPMSDPLDGTGQIINVPDEFVNTVKYGSLADALTKMGRGQDPSRIQYCHQRFQLGIDVARLLLMGWKR